MLNPQKINPVEVSATREDQGASAYRPDNASAGILIMDGWIKLYRKFTEWEWFEDGNMVKLFIYLLLHVNHKPGQWKGINVDRGQLITGLKSLSKKTSISIQSLRTCLKRLEKTGEINRQTNNQYSVITLTNYDSYQQNDNETNKRTNKRPTSNQQAINKQSTTNKNEKNEKNEENEENINERFEKFISLFNEILGRSYRGTKKAKSHFKQRIKENYTASQIIDAVKSAKADKYHKDTRFKFLTPEYILREDQLNKWSNVINYEDAYKPSDYLT